MEYEDELRDIIRRIRVNDPGVGPKQKQWARNAANAMGMDWNTLTLGGTGDAVRSGAAQGATLNWGDELKALGAQIVPGGDDYRQSLEKSSAARAANEFMNPGASLGGELLGSLAPAFLPGVNVASAVRAPGLINKARGVAQAIGIGAAEGAAAGLGQQEGSKIPGWEALYGAGGGALGGAAGATLIEPFARFTLRAGETVSKAVAKEFERLVKETGMGPDEIIQYIERGEGPLLSKNKTFLRMAHTWANRGNPARTAAMGEDLSNEALRGRQQVLQTMQAQTDVPPNLEAAREAIKPPGTDYPRAYAAGDARLPDVRPDLTPVNEMVEQAALLDPKFIDTANRNSRARYVQTYGREPDVPLLGQDETGRVTFQRQPTTEDYDYLDRSARDRASDMYQRETQFVGAEAEGLDELQKSMRTELDTIFPELARARENSAVAKSAIEAFEAASKIGPSSTKVDEFLSSYSRMGPVQQAHARAGLIARIAPQLRNAPVGGNPLRLLTQNEELSPAYAMLLAEVFPQGELDQVIRRAANIQSAANAVTGAGQSITDFAQQAGRRMGGDLKPLSEVTLPGMALEGARRLYNFVGGSRTMTPDEFSDLLRIGMSEDPDFVRKALNRDPGALATIRRFMSPDPTTAGALPGAVLATEEEPLTIFDE